MKNNVVLYHKHCLDGFGAAYAAWKYIGDMADYIPVSYDEPLPEGLDSKCVYILDFSYPRDVLDKLSESARFLVVLDHHKTAQEALKNAPYATFDMNKSGCRLAWEEFNENIEMPKLLQHIEDRDLWRFDMPETKAITTALYSLQPWSFEQFDSVSLDELMDIGDILIKVFDADIERLLNKKHAINIAGVAGLACNAPPKYSSELGHKLAKLSGTFGCTYSYSGETRNVWDYSLRSVGDFDVTRLAIRHGGGGHKNAAGFSADKLLE